MEMLKSMQWSNEPTGSMGDDTLISRKIRSLYDNCRQKFAQVTSPIDSLRKKSVMSLDLYWTRTEHI